MKATIHYYDIGDYLSQQDKLKIVKNFKSIVNLPFVELQPNKEGDWINERNESFDSFIPLAPEKKFDLKTQSFFNTYAIGVATNRDAWVYNFSKTEIEKNMQQMIAFYNQQREDFLIAKQKNPNLDIEDFIDTDATKISWTVNLKKDLEKNKINELKKSEFNLGYYRPFLKQNYYFDKTFIERPGINPKLFPNPKLKNLAICLTGMGASKDFSVTLTDSIPDIQVIMNGQVFPLYYYEERQKQTQTKMQFDAPESGTSEFVRRDAISDFILDQAKERYGKNVSKEDIFYYVYGLLHSKEYRETFANDLKKMLPRLPLLEDVRDFWKFSKAGRELADLHINYENQPTPAGVIVIHNPLTITDIMKSLSEDELKYIDYRVDKMRFPKKDQKETIYYNSRITIDNIPAKAYEYVVNGKPAIEWIMERYAITTHKESQITNNPNDWSEEVGNPKYILDLLLSVINVSLQTVDIVEGLPKVEF